MNKEQLIALGLTVEQADKVIEGYGTTIPKTRFDEVNIAKKQLETDLASRDQQLEELKKVDATGLQAQIEKLQGENATAKEKYEADLETTRLTSALKLALHGKVHDADLVTSLIDKATIELGEDGNVAKGLDEQIKTLRESKSFLFVPEKQGTPGFKGVTPAEGGQSTKTETKAGDYGKQMAENLAESNKGLEDARKSYFD